TLRFLYILHFFFFSSRRRHTLSKRDWSSDVCSSDLIDSAGRHRTSGHCALVVPARTCTTPVREEPLLVTVVRRPFVQLPVRGAELHHGTDRAGDRLRRRRRSRSA